MAGLHVALVNEGTYPYAAGGVSTWCDQLVRGLSDVTWHLVTVVGTEPARTAVPLPANVGTLTTVPVWAGARRPRQRALAAAERLCRGMLGDTPADRADFEAGLRELAAVATGGRAVAPARRAAGGRSPKPGTARPVTGRHPLFDVPLADVLLDAWGEALDRGTRLPRLTLREADDAAVLLEHARPAAGRLGTAGRRGARHRERAVVADRDGREVAHRRAVRDDRTRRVPARTVPVRRPTRRPA